MNIFYSNFVFHGEKTTNSFISTRRLTAVDISLRLLFVAISRAWTTNSGGILPVASRFQYRRRDSIPISCSNPGVVFNSGLVFRTRFRVSIPASGFQSRLGVSIPAMSNSEAMTERDGSGQGRVVIVVPNGLEKVGRGGTDDDGSGDAGLVGGLAVRCESWTLAGGLEAGGFSISARTGGLASGGDSASRYRFWYW